MRVLHVNAGNMYGGVETLLVTLARCRELCPEMEPSFALCFEGRLSKELVEAGSPVHFLGETRTSRFWSIVAARRRMRDLLALKKFDLVVTHMSWSHAIFGPEVKRAGLRLVNWVHGIPNGRHWLEKWAARTTPDLAVCNSLVTARSVPRLFGNAENEVVYYPVAALNRNGLDGSLVRRSLGVDQGSVVILQASRMEPWKGHQLHLECLSRLKGLDNWICLMVGGAQRLQERRYMQRLQRLAIEFQISDRVRFLGQRSDVPSLMRAADIFCQPNQEPEPFGIVFLEALQAGLPVVSTNMGGAAEIINESCGILTPPGNPEALAEVLGRLIQNPTQRRSLGDAGPARARVLCEPATQIRQLGDVLGRAA
jgi:glycosyltransferase involved in cell wall biosynthesis